MYTSYLRICISNYEEGRSKDKNPGIYYKIVIVFPLYSSIHNSSFCKIDVHIDGSVESNNAISILNL